MCAARHALRSGSGLAHVAHPLSIDDFHVRFDRRVVGDQVVAGAAGGLDHLQQAPAVGELDDIFRVAQKGKFGRAILDENQVAIERYTGYIESPRTRSALDRTKAARGARSKPIFLPPLPPSTS